MTDKEMAEEYVKNRYGTLCVCGSSALQQAFFAGLKAGKSKWHKVTDGDLPKNRCSVWITYINAYHQTETTEASFRRKYWVISGHRTECEVIAWCEIPKYMEE